MDVKSYACGNSPETTIHVLRDCREMVIIWTKLLGRDQSDNFFSLPLKDWLIHNLKSQEIFQRTNIAWAMVFGVACWCIWGWHNKDLFEDEFDRNGNLVGYICFKVKQFSFAYSMDDNLCMTNVKQCRLIGWSALALGWIKANSYGTMKMNTGKAVTSGLFQDETGKWLYGFSVNLGRALMTELWGAWYVLKIA